MSEPAYDTEEAPQMQLSPRLLDLWESEIVPQLPERLDEQARARKRVSTLPRDQASQRSAPSVAGLGTGRMLVRASWDAGRCYWEWPISRKRLGASACASVGSGCTGC